MRELAAYPEPGFSASGCPKLGHIHHLLCPTSAPSTFQHCVRTPLRESSTHPSRTHSTQSEVADRASEWQMLRPTIPIGGLLRGKGWGHKASMGIPREARLHIINEGNIRATKPCRMHAECRLHPRLCWWACRKAESLRRHYTSEANQTCEEEAIVHLPIKKFPDSGATSGEYQPCVSHYAKYREASEGCLVLPQNYAPVCGDSTLEIAHVMWQHEAYKKTLVPPKVLLPIFPSNSFNTTVSLTFL